MSVYLIEHHTLTTEIELERQLAILLISAQHEVFCEFAPLLLYILENVPRHH